MKKHHWVPVVCGFIALFVGSSGPLQVEAEAETNGEMGIGFKGLVDPNFGILDPENPSKELVYEEEYGHTSGALRIDFAPNISFNRNKISKNDSNYLADSLLFKEVIAPRGNFLQVSDYREEQTGWSLQVRQETQFKNQEKAELNGAVISFDKTWINTRNGTSQYPSVSKEVIRLINVGETYTLAKAAERTGGGTWSVVFGASQDNPMNETPTLTPRLDETRKAVLDPFTENQAVYMNDAVRLSIPGGTEKKPGTYTTVLTWILSELP